MSAGRYPDFQSCQAHTARNGSASAPRQKPVAVGPVSLRRTKMPEVAMPSALTSSARRASDCVVFEFRRIEAYFGIISRKSGGTPT